MKNIIRNGLHCICTPWTHLRTGQVSHFLRKEDSCDRTLLIYIVLFIFNIETQISCAKNIWQFYNTWQRSGKSWVVTWQRSGKIWLVAWQITVIKLGSHMPKDGRKAGWSHEKGRAKSLAVTCQRSVEQLWCSHDKGRSNSCGGHMTKDGRTAVVVTWQRMNAKPRQSYDKKRSKSWVVTWQRKDKVG